MSEVFTAAFAVAALAWLVWRRLRYERRLRSMSGLFVAPPRPALGLASKVTAADVRRMFSTSRASATTRSAAPI